jgi:hypothetical protein
LLILIPFYTIAEKLLVVELTGMTLGIFGEVEYPTNSISKVNSIARANTAGQGFF